ncbi:MAG TPA: hypothetical protein VF665_22580 [Longimicrobium sp.]|jgi:hypothetical protein|uniref:hypothetical protein n=1 Tax=Longimicrobium sp. TaxID=2029185 RepID=UPI002ED98CB9
MQRRILLSGLIAAALSAVAACSDETPTLSGDEAFPPGTTPVTREVLVPASQFLRVLGTYSGYTDASDAPFVEIAENYEGLYAHALTRFNGFPTSVTYRGANGQRTDSTFTYLASNLVARFDTLASTRERVTLSVYAAAESWDPGSATWELRADTNGVRTPWREPGGTRGALLAQAVRSPGGPDSVVFSIPAAAVRALSDSLSPGVIITSTAPGSRLRLTGLQLRAAVRPDSAAARDTTITTTVNSGAKAGLFTPDQPNPPAGAFAVGGIRSARTLLEVNTRQQVPACASGATCGTVPLSQVELNSVALVLRAVDVPNGFDLLGTVPLRLRRVSEPELGRFAPLGAVVSEEPAARFNGADSTVAVSITALSFASAVNADLPTAFALVSEGFGNAPSSFGVSFFRSDPLLRIVYTIRARRTLP